MKYVLNLLTPDLIVMKCNMMWYKYLQEWHKKFHILFLFPLNISFCYHPIKLPHWSSSLRISQTLLLIIFRWNFFLISIFHFGFKVAIFVTSQKNISYSSHQNIFLSSRSTFTFWLKYILSTSMILSWRFERGPHLGGTKQTGEVEDTAV